MLRISFDSYNLLKTNKIDAWHEDSKYYCDRNLLTSEFKNLVEELSAYKIHRYTSEVEDIYSHPATIIFPDNLNKHLPKKDFIALGEKVKIIYFDRLENNVFVEPIIKIEYEFIRDDIGYLKHIVRKISWALENNLWSKKTQVDLIPVASNQEKLLEIEKRRQNIISEVAGLSRDIELKTALSDLYSKYNTEINLYLKSGSTALAVAVENNTDLLWLNDPTPSNKNKTVREFLIEYFTIGVTTNL